MEEFERHIYESVQQSVTIIEADSADRIYALSFFIYDDGDDPRRPTLSVGLSRSSCMSSSIMTKSRNRRAGLILPV